MSKEKEIFKQLEKAVREYDDLSVSNLVRESIKNDIDPTKTIDVLTSTVADIGKKFEGGDFFLPDLVLAGEILKVGMSLLEDEMKKKGINNITKKTLGKIVIGTVFGDIHDIGKNMVATLLSVNGFEVINLGVNVKSEYFINAIESYKPDILAMSALLTTTAPEQSKVIEALKEKKLRDEIKIMVGGAPITIEFAENIGADGYEPTAPLAVRLAKSFIS